MGVTGQITSTLTLPVEGEGLSVSGLCNKGIPNNGQA
jgi:hypothetical protein